MFGESVMSYSYNDTEALRHSASFLAALTLFFAFLGGYFSYQVGWWWMGFFALLVIKWFSGFLYLPHGKRYDNILRYVVSAVVALLFFLVFLLGYWLAPYGLWFLGLVVFGVYFALAKVITKPYKKKGH